MLTPISLTDLESFPEPTLILVSIDLETVPTSLDSHIPLIERECEFQFFDLDPNVELIPTLKPTLDFFELVMVPKPITLEPKSSNSGITFLC